MCPAHPASMMRSWSDGQSLDRAELIRKDAPMLYLTPTSCKVHDLWISETQARAERYHALTRNDVAPEKLAAPRLTFQWPRISLVRRLLQLRPRPA